MTRARQDVCVCVCIQTPHYLRGTPSRHILVHRQHSDNPTLFHLSIDIKALQQHMHKPKVVPEAAYMLAEHAYFTSGYGPRISAD